MAMSRSSFVSRWRHAFAWTPHGAAVDGIGPTAVAVALVMSEYADWKTGANIRPGHDRLAVVVGVTKAAIKRAIKSLEAAGWIENEQRGSFGRASVYRLAIPSLVDMGTGEVSAPVTGSPAIPWGSRAGHRNGVISTSVTGSLVTPHLCHDPCRPRALTLVAA